MYNLRKVNNNDIQTLFNWANDPDSRANAKNSEIIKWEDHVKWFNKKMSGDSSFIYILEDREINKDFGIVRFDKNKDDFVISYFIIKEHRGKGLGTLILKEGFKNLQTIVENINLLAYVKSGNIASEKVFEKLDFNLEKEEIINNIKYKIFQKKIR